MPAMTVFIWLIVKIMLFRHEFRDFPSIRVHQKGGAWHQIRVHSAGFADGLAWLFGRFKTADKVFGNFTHATQRNVRRIFFLIGGEKAGVEANNAGLVNGSACNKEQDWQSVRGQHQRMRVRKMPRQFKAVRFGKQVAVIA